jgi:hypothetical protein
MPGFGNWNIWLQIPGGLFRVGGDLSALFKSLCRQWYGPAGKRWLVLTSRADHNQESVEQFVKGMTGEQRMLVVLKRELYDGSWDEMVADLRARLEGRPYIFKLAHRIADDLDRIEVLRRFERQYGVDLSQKIDKP